MKEMEDAILDEIEEILEKSKKKKPVFFLANSSSFEKDCQKYLKAIKNNKRVINRIWNRYIKKNKIKLNNDNFSKIARKFLEEHLVQAVRKAYKRQLEKQKKRKLTVLKRKKTQKKTIYVLKDKKENGLDFESKFKRAIRENPSVDVNYVASACIKTLSDNEKYGLAIKTSGFSRKDFNQMLLKWKAEALNPQKVRQPKTIQRKIKAKTR